VVAHLVLVDFSLLAQNFSCVSCVVLFHELSWGCFRFISDVFNVFLDIITFFFAVGCVEFVNFFIVLLWCFRLFGISCAAFNHVTEDLLKVVFLSGMTFIKFHENFLCVLLNINQFFTIALDSLFTSKFNIFFLFSQNSSRFIKVYQWLHTTIALISIKTTCRKELTCWLSLTASIQARWLGIRTLKAI
jgi:hypothetical protein